MTYVSQPTAPYFGTARPGVREADPNYGMEALRVTTTYINNTPNSITVGRRCGLKIPVPSRHQYGLPSEFIIRHEIFVSGMVKDNLRQLLNGVDEDSSVELRALKEAFSTPGNIKFSGASTLVLDYPVQFRQLRDCGGSLYYVEADEVVSILSPETAPEHPYSEAGRKANVVAGTPVRMDGQNFGYCIEIVDNLGKFGARYVNIANQIYRVVPRRDHTLRDGIYIASPQPSNGEYQNSEIKVVHHSLDADDLENFGIFKTYEDALNLGDLTVARKKELASIEHDNLKLKRDLETIRHSHDLEKAESDKRIRDLEAERDRRINELKEQQNRHEHEMAMERLKKKDQYEERSQSRKDSSEALKVLPSIIIGIGAIAVALKTIMGGSSGKLSLMR